MGSVPRGGRKWNQKKNRYLCYVSKFSYGTAVHVLVRHLLGYFSQFVSQEAQARTDELRQYKSILRYGGTSGISLSPTLGAQL